MGGEGGREGGKGVRCDVLSWFYLKGWGCEVGSISYWIWEEVVYLSANRHRINGLRSMRWRYRPVAVFVCEGCFRY